MDEWEMWDMHDETRLSPRERITLLQIEADLRKDRRFTRRMAVVRRPGRREIWLPVSALLLGAASVFVAVMGIRTSDTALLWCFALLWPLTLFQAFRLLCRAAGRGPRASHRTTPWL
ncbi:DUF3040 domain-containing protein [Streptomyces sp. NPDC059688]|uniref:DUF3040 domain-containing protein n=2 Tax=Streptomyces TaxID=1883 RepID=A0ABV1U011_9ACTN|nr:MULTISPECIES: DUF3040 domain-containing protein [unclassified Streptomyces]OKJ81722.1 hypothetical protein AMK32_20135 [Streptomyces sp. CB01883]UXY34184.1 DUF3040 domain-containing protein [Streptomyces sp. HUAS 14-6]